MRIFYSAVKQGCILFYFDSKTTIQIVPLYCAALVFFRKIILTGCCLVTRTVKLISTDPYINVYIIHRLLPSLCIGENHGTVFEWIIIL